MNDLYPFFSLLAFGVECPKHLDCTSIPSQDVTGPIEKHNINEGQPRPQQQVETSATTNEIKSRNIVDLKRWHVKFDGSGKAFTAEGYIFLP